MVLVLTTGMTRQSMRLSSFLLVSSSRMIGVEPCSNSAELAFSDMLATWAFSESAAIASVC